MPYFEVLFSEPQQRHHYSFVVVLLLNPASQNLAGSSGGLDFRLELESGSV
jgi:hypothetical protein